MRRHTSNLCVLCVSVVHSLFTMPTTLVRDVMQVGVPTCREDTPLKEAARLLVERNVGALIVLDEDANMTGWIGEHHMARVKIAHCTNRFLTRLRRIRNDAGASIRIRPPENRFVQ